MQHNQEVAAQTKSVVKHMNKLEKAGLSSEQSKAFIEANAESIGLAVAPVLKQVNLLGDDVKDVSTEVKNVDTGLRAEIRNSETRLEIKIDRVDTKVDVNIGNVGAGLRADIRGLKKCLRMILVGVILNLSGTVGSMLGLLP